MPVIRATHTEILKDIVWQAIAPGRALCGQCYQMLATGLRMQRIPRTPCTAHKSLTNSSNRNKLITRPIPYSARNWGLRRSLKALRPS